MPDGEDVYDVVRYVWCSLCSEQHEPCEVDNEGYDIGTHDPGTFCGCCGRSISEIGGGDWWCLDCEDHVARISKHIWESTYFFLNAEPCPFMEK